MTIQHTFQTPAELAGWLADSGIDTAGWGVGPFKGLADLWAEYTLSLIHISEPTRPY